MPSRSERDLVGAVGREPVPAGAVLDGVVLHGGAAHRFDAAVAGHASAGNPHFTMRSDPADPADVKRYARCLEEIVTLIVDRFDGSPEGGHGTGRPPAGNRTRQPALRHAAGHPCQSALVAWESAARPPEVRNGVHRDE
ncbi:FAD-linked oxidase C-terminal domain-containing protein [Nonomuraea antri]|uniref:FAD-linked oxidase C-terminal domain-containing protein n=1 Tax=Nonomuraea antri TaxID=2730852 RepID=UPI001C2C06B7|nr:FAD-linked oxidase C-terminal domain-containing protein [Nonomuraea antri]